MSNIIRPNFRRSPRPVSEWHPMCNAFGFGPVEDEWSPPLVDTTGCLDGYAVWVGNTKVKTFSNLTLALRFAGEIREMIGAAQ